MKKYLAILLIVASFVVPPQVTHAGVLEDLYAQIFQLQQMILQLISQQNGATSTNSILTDAPKLTSATYVSGKDTGFVVGSGLQNAKVYFNGSLIGKEDYTYRTDSQVSFMMPTFQPGTYAVYVVSTSGQSNTVSLVVEN